MMQKLLWISDNPTFQHVGQARVTREFCTRLKDNFDLTVGGFSSPSHTETAVTQPLTFPVEVIDRYNCEKTVELITKVNPDMIVLCHDIWLFPYLPELKKKFPNKKIIAYITIDGEPFSRKWKPLTDCCDLVIVPSEWGREVIHQRYFDIPIEVVPYGVDRKFGAFRKVKDRNALKKEITLCGIQVFNLADKFVAFSIGHSQGRKNWSCARDAWGMFAHDKNDVIYIMVLHSLLVPMEGWPPMPGEFDIVEFLRTPSLQPVDRCLTEDDYLKFLSASDVLLFPTIGEGFGLPILEAMSCGTVPIVTNYSSYLDFCKVDNSFFIEGSKLCNPYWNVNRMIADPRDMAKKIETAYRLWKEGHLEVKRDRCVKVAEEYNWDKSSDKMKDILFRESLLNRQFVVNEV